MTGEVSGKDLPRLRVVRLDKLNEEFKANKPATSNLANNPQKVTEQAVNITLSANVASKVAIERVAQLAGSPIQKEVTLAMEQAAKSKKEDVDSLAKRIADDVIDDPGSAMDAIGLTGSSAEVLKGTTQA